MVLICNVGKSRQLGKKSKNFFKKSFLYFEQEPCQHFLPAGTVPTVLDLKNYSKDVIVRHWSVCSDVG
jgi:hypothetical protein